MEFADGKSRETSRRRADNTEKREEITEEESVLGGSARERAER